MLESFLYITKTEVFKLMPLLVSVCLCCMFCFSWSDDLVGASHVHLCGSSLTVTLGKTKSLSTAFFDRSCQSLAPRYLDYLLCNFFELEAMLASLYYVDLDFLRQIQVEELE